MAGRRRPANGRNRPIRITSTIAIGSRRIDLAMFAGGGNRHSRGGRKHGGGRDRRSAGQCRPRLGELLPRAAGARGARAHVRAIGRSSAARNAGCGGERRLSGSGSSIATAMCSAEPSSSISSHSPSWASCRRTSAARARRVDAHPRRTSGSRSGATPCSNPAARACRVARRGGVCSPSAAFAKASAFAQARARGRGRGRGPRPRISRTASRPRAADLARDGFRSPRPAGQEATMLGIAGAATTAGHADRLRQRRGPAPRTAPRHAVRKSRSGCRLVPAGVRILRQFLTEGLMLSIVGTGFGFIVAGWAIGLASGGRGASDRDATAESWLYAAVCSTAVATLSAGLMPAIQASRTALLPGLDPNGDARVLDGCARSLVGAEVADLARPAADGCVAVARCRARERRRSGDARRQPARNLDGRHRHGYEGARLDAVRARGPAPSSRRFLECGRRRSSIPRHSAVLASATGSRRGDAPDSPAVSTVPRGVSPGFPDVIGLQLVRGRWFERHAPAKRSSSTSRSPARLWPGADPLGQRLTTGDFNRRSHVVVGVVRDTPYAELRHQHEPFLFRPGRRERSWSARPDRPRPWRVRRTSRGETTRRSPRGHVGAAG